MSFAVVSHSEELMIDTAKGIIINDFSSSSQEKRQLVMFKKLIIYIAIGSKGLNQERGPPFQGIVQTLWKR